MEKVIRINIARDFTTTPGARNESDGPFSGEEFRKTFLEKHFKDLMADYKIEIILDGTEGYATSFLDEAFGAVARKYGKERCIRRLVFVSEEDPLLIEEILSYINDSNG